MQDAIFSPVGGGQTFAWPAIKKGAAKAVPYLVEGIGEDIIPKSIHFQYMDEFVEVNDQESFQMARRLAREEGMFVGGSSGSAVAGAVRWLSKRPLPEGSTVIVILPDKDVDFGDVELGDQIWVGAWETPVGRTWNAVRIPHDLPQEQVSAWIASQVGARV